MNFFITNYIHTMENQYIRSIITNKIPKIQVTEDKICETYHTKLPLFTYQKYIVQLMLDIENFKYYKVNGIVNFNQSGFLKEPLGTGKTVEILALISTNQIPNNMYVKYISLQDDFISKVYPENRKKKTSVISINSSILKQWISETEKFTYLSWYVINSRESLIHYITNIQNLNYDILFITDGSVLNNDSEIITIIKSYNSEFTEFKILKKILYSSVLALIEFQFTRVIFDDYFLLNSNFRNLIPTGFTWFISSTAKDDRFYSKGVYRLSDDNTYDFNLLNLYNIHENFIVKCSNSDIENYDSLFFKIKYKVIFLHKKSDHLIKNIVELSGINQYYDLINSDCYDTIFKKYKIRCNNIYDLFKFVLKKNYGNVAKSFVAIKKLKIIKQEINNYITIDYENFDDFGNYQNLTEHEFHVKYGNIKNLNKIIEEKVKYPNMENDICNIIERLEIYKKKKLELLDKVHLEKDCLICNKINMDRTVIMNCCINSICEECFIKHFNVFKSEVCPFCRKVLYTNNVMVFDNHNKLEYIKMLGEIKESQEPQEPQETQEPQEIEKNKFDVLLDILNNNIKYENDIVIDIPNVVYGKKEVEVENDNIKKVLIYSNLIESKRKIIKNLKFTNFILIENFNDFIESKKNCIMILDVKKEYAGINLQCTTDIIFIENYFTYTTDYQIIGRGQRIGRTNNLKVWFLLYENEKDYFNKKYYTKL